MAKGAHRHYVTCSQLLGNKTRGTQVSDSKWVLFAQLYLSFSITEDPERTLQARHVWETPPTSTAEDTYSYVNWDTGRDYSHGCVCGRVCVHAHVRVNIAKKEKYHVLCREENPQTLKNPEESAIVLKHRRDHARGEPAWEAVATGNITQFGLPVLGIHVACCLQASQSEESEQGPQTREGGRPSSRSKPTPSLLAPGWR